MRIRRLMRENVISKLPPKWKNIAERWYYYRVMDYVKNDVRIIKKLSSPEKISLDIGANQGQLTLFLCKYSSHVYCFEPIRILSDYLIHRFRGCNVSVEDCALGSDNAELYLSIPIIRNRKIETRGSLVMNFENEYILGELVEEVERVKIRVRKLDDFCFNDVGFIKIDVEGYEMQVLEGGRATIERCRPNMLIEIEQRFHKETQLIDIFRYILDMGYSGYFLYKNKLMDIEQFDGKKMQHPDNERSSNYVSNFIFLNPSLIDSGISLKQFLRY
jgi:FkbM family methyltransferase